MTYNIQSLLPIVEEVAPKGRGLLAVDLQMAAHLFETRYPALRPAPTWGEWKEAFAQVGQEQKPPYSETQAIIELGHLDYERFKQGNERCLTAGGCPECLCVATEQGREHWAHCSKAKTDGGQP